MFRVSLINLTPDLRAARPDLGTRDAGELNAAELTALLHSFRDIDPVQNHDAEPQVVIDAPHGRSLIRTRHGKLYLYTGRGELTEFTELPPARLVAELVREAGGAVAPDASPLTPQPRRPWLAVALLIGAVALNAFTVYSFLSTDRPARPHAAVVVAEAREAAALRSSARGRYQTGTEPGDRAIEITVDDRVRFLRLTEKGERLDAEDTYQPARQDRKVVLLTGQSGLIDVANIDTLSYYGDVYRRK